MKTAWVLRHVAFEDLGILHPILEEQGFAICFLESGVDRLEEYDVLHPDLVIVLGGPIAVYEQDEYPCVSLELSWLQPRVAAGKPTLGICLGAQMLIHILGGRVFPGHYKELGWLPLQVDDVKGGSFVEHLTDSQNRVLAWHGDAYVVPASVNSLARTEHYEGQVFSTANHRILGTLFHPEFDPRFVERWLIGHYFEIHHHSQTSVRVLRDDTKRYGNRSMVQGRLFFEGWLRYVYDEFVEAQKS